MLSGQLFSDIIAKKATQGEPMDNIAEFLKHTKLLREIPVEIIDAHIVPKGTLERYTKGEMLIHAQQKIDDIKILISGKVNILYYYEDGSYSLATTETPPRVLALDLIATRSRRSPYFAVASEDSVVFSVPSGLILKPGEMPEPERQTILNNFLIMLSHLHMQKEKHLMALSRNGLRDRIMTYLSLQAQWKKSHCFEIPFSREEMAAYLCVNRSALSHELSLMRKEGLIDFSKNHFVLLKYSKVNKDNRYSL